MCLAISATQLLFHQTALRLLTTMLPLLLQHIDILWRMHCNHTGAPDLLSRAAPSVSAACLLLVSRLSAADRYTRLAAASSPAADISVMLQLVLLARHISSRLNALETHLRSTLAQTIPRLQALAAAGVSPLGLPPPTAAAAGHNQQQQGAGVPAAAAAAAAELLPLRLAAFPAKLQPLGKLQAAAASSRFMSLPSATVAGAVKICKHRMHMHLMC
jgi:hypothetical protein